MNTRSILITLAASLVAFNVADLATTWFLVSTGKGVEANPIVLLMGGPFSPFELVMKIAVFPAAALGVAWWMYRKLESPRLAMVAIVPSVIGLGVVVANNVIIAAKKVEKTAKKVKKTVVER